MLKYIKDQWNERFDIACEKMEDREELNFTERLAIAPIILFADILFSVVGLACNISSTIKEDCENFGYYRVKTPTHVARIVDDAMGEPLLLVRKRGFLKQWHNIGPKHIPTFLAEEIFDASCTAKRRAQLLNKIIKLRAFW